MTVWLYQMRANYWEPEKYRMKVWEHEKCEFETGKINPSDEKPKSGDTIIFFYIKTDTNEPGIYGWGIILINDQKKKIIQFRPTNPSDYLKMNPIWGNDIENLINEIRGKTPRGTMWKVTDDQAIIIRKNIHSWCFQYSRGNENDKKRKRRVNFKYNH